MNRILANWRRIGASGLLVLSMFASQFAGVPIASAATTLTWTGAAADNNFSTATNWQGDVAPIDGDSLIFNVTSLTANETLINDITGLSIDGISFTGTSSGYYKYDITGNALTLSGTLNSTNYSNILTDVVLGGPITLQGTISIDGNTLDTQGHDISWASTSCSSLPQLIGSGNLSVSGTGSSSLPNSSPNYTGSITVTSTLFASAGGLGSATGGTTVSGSGELSFFLASNGTTIAEPLTLSGSGLVSAQHGSSNGCSGVMPSGVYATTFSGPVTLLSDFKYGGADNATIAGTYTPNGHTFSVVSGASGILTLPTGSVEAQIEVTEYKDNLPDQYLSIGANQVAIVDGARGSVLVGLGGILRGVGTASSVWLNVGGIVAPGHSPGKLTVLTSLQLDGTYQAELLNKDTYDQIQVSDATRTTGSDVLIGSGAILDVVLFDGYVINKGETFTIINNLQPATQLVVGEFAGLGEGAQITINDVVFSISYIGGDGNDVVLTALTSGVSPNAPNTGFSLNLRSPVLIATIGFMAVIMLMVVRRLARQR